VPSGVTLIIPTIPQRSSLLARSIASVGRQTLPPDAVIVPVDFEGVGAGPTRNRAVAMATTEWVAFLDDDDELAYSHIEDLMDAAADNDADMVYPWFTTVGADKSALLTVQDGELVDPEGVPFGEEQRALVGAGPEGDGRNFIPITYLIRRELFEELGGFPTTNSDEWPHPANEDWGFLIKLARSDAKIVHLNARTWFWNFHSRSTLGGGAS
jgi:glycosyltransferase involved in cell wall biosynthesis